MCLRIDHTTSKCPNKRGMILKDVRNIKTVGNSDDESMPCLEDISNAEYPIDGELLIAKRALILQIKENEKVQCENIFYAICHVSNKVCSMIIAGRSCTNVVSTSLVEKLNLTILKHPRLYKLQYLNDFGEVKVNKQVIV